ncbi:hypothetical protein SAMN05444422_11335 [Halobiforma haloterrestris]|uniref:Uncharacterized protein n=1 Tax=Natronobacterium haloterrestre TaxID=148448 RepID=A0A1I1KW96_NATHA|nr:hypothetical protein SAMN05444422_11335 [Halobiforma haloterrestris]
MNARCPECDGLGELLEKRSLEGGVRGIFECSNCGTEWSTAI